MQTLLPLGSWRRCFPELRTLQEACVRGSCALLPLATKSLGKFRDAKYQSDTRCDVVDVYECAGTCLPCLCFCISIFPMLLPLEFLVPGALCLSSFCPLTLTSVLRLCVCPSLSVCRLGVCAGFAHDSVVQEGHHYINKRASPQKTSFRSQPQARKE